MQTFIRVQDIRLPGDGKCLAARWLAMQRVLHADIWDPSTIKVYVECALGTKLPDENINLISVIDRLTPSDSPAIREMIAHAVIEVVSSGGCVRGVSIYEKILPTMKSNLPIMRIVRKSAVPFPEFAPPPTHWRHDGNSSITDDDIERLLQEMGHPQNYFT